MIFLIPTSTPIKRKMNEDLFEELQGVKEEIKALTQRKGDLVNEIKENLSEGETFSWGGKKWFLREKDFRPLKSAKQRREDTVNFLKNIDLGEGPESLFETLEDLRKKPDSNLKVELASVKEV